MLIRLAPGVSYPAHSHEGVEELHLPYGQLWIEDRKLCPGDYNRAESGTADNVCGARPAARVFLSPRLETNFANLFFLNLPL